MEGIYPELALCGIKKQCAWTDTVCLHFSEVSKGMVSLTKRITRGYEILGTIIAFLKDLFIGKQKVYVWLELRQS